MQALPHVTGEVKYAKGAFVELLITVTYTLARLNSNLFTHKILYYPGHLNSAKRP